MINYIAKLFYKAIEHSFTRVTAKLLLVPPWYLFPLPRFPHYAITQSLWGTKGKHNKKHDSSRVRFLPASRAALHVTYFVSSQNQRAERPMWWGRTYLRHERCTLGAGTHPSMRVKGATCFPLISSCYPIGSDLGSQGIALSLQRDPGLFSPPLRHKSYKPSSH